MKPSLHHPAVVLPMNDPQGLYFPHLQAVTPDLKALFERAFISITLATRQAFPGYYDWATADDFFHVVAHGDDLPVGDDFLNLYRTAASLGAPDRLLHLAFIDRVAFALQSHHRDPFMADVQAVQPEDTPLIFQRSAAAWASHPAVYRQFEGMVTTAGERLLGISLDFTWCHLAVQAGQMAVALTKVRKHDLSIMTELLLRLLPDVQTRDVDWLAWEDPFILGRDAEELKVEREGSLAEARKRLSYVIPSLQLLYEAAGDRS